MSTKDQPTDPSEGCNELSIQNGKATTPVTDSETLISARNESPKKTPRRGRTVKLSAKAQALADEKDASATSKVPSKVDRVKSNNGAGGGFGGGSAPSYGSRRRESAGDERFNFGSKRGQTFRQVARNDPSYHLRCSATGYNPDPYQMARYREYFDRYGDQYAAARGERGAIGFAIGICPPDMFGQYDSD